MSFQNAVKPVLKSLHWCKLEKWSLRFEQHFSPLGCQGIPWRVFCLPRQTPQILAKLMAWSHLTEVIWAPSAPAVSLRGPFPYQVWDQTHLLYHNVFKHILLFEKESHKAQVFSKSLPKNEPLTAWQERRTGHAIRTIAVLFFFFSQTLTESFHSLNKRHAPLSILCPATTPPRSPPKCEGPRWYSRLQELSLAGKILSICRIGTRH